MMKYDNEENLVQGPEFPLPEKRHIEQYFFTENVLSNLVESLQYYENIVCLCTPAVADAFHRLLNKTVICLDIDERFNYLPGFIKYDIQKPEEIEIKPDVIIFDPPFFQINLVTMLNCINKLTKNDYSTHLIFAFVHREQKALLSIFKQYDLKLTKFKLEYQSVESHKWDNYALYSNKEMNKIKFLKFKK